MWISWNGNSLDEIVEERKEACPRITMIETHHFALQNVRNQPASSHHPPESENRSRGKNRQRCKTKHLQSLAQGSAQVVSDISSHSVSADKKLQARPFGSPPSHFIHSLLPKVPSLPRLGERGRVASTLLMRLVSPLHSPLLRSSFGSCVMSAQCLRRTDAGSRISFRAAMDFLLLCGRFMVGQGYIET